MCVFYRYKARRTQDVDGSEQLIFIQESIQTKMINKIAVVDTKFLDIDAFQYFNINIHDDPPELHAGSSKDHQALSK